MSAQRRAPTTDPADKGPALLQSRGAALHADEADWAGTGATVQEVEQAEEAAEQAASVIQAVARRGRAASQGAAASGGGGGGGGGAVSRLALQSGGSLPTRRFSLRRGAAARAGGGGFEDPDFPAAEASLGELGETGKVKWYRAAALMPAGHEVRLFSGIEPNDVMQGALGDCWLLAATAAVAEFPAFIASQLFVTPRANPEGRCELRRPRPRGTPSCTWLHVPAPHCTVLHLATPCYALLRLAAPVSSREQVRAPPLRRLLAAVGDGGGGRPHPVRAAPLLLGGAAAALRQE